MKHPRTVYATQEAPQPIGPYSQAIKAGGTLYISGQIGLNPQTGELANNDLHAETRQMMSNVKAILKEAGLTLDHVVKCTIYLDNMDDFATINQVYGEYFGEEPPAREAIEISKLPKGANVEISVIAME